MYPLKRRFVHSLALISLAAVGGQFCPAQPVSDGLSTWWPDPSTGLMWAGQAYGQPQPLEYNRSYRGLEWKDATAYCASLELGGFSGWRLPSLDELKSITVTKKTSGPYPTFYGMENKAQREMDDAVSQMPFNALFLKVGITLECGNCQIGQQIWTSTLAPNYGKSAWIGVLGSADASFAPIPMSSNGPLALCARPMEADLLQIARDAQVDGPVPDIQTLEKYIPLNKARLAYQAGLYPESITQAQEAIKMKTEPATAYFGLGISYGMLGKWDLAVTTIQTAVKLDKDNKDFKGALKWAKEGQKAAKKGQAPKESSPKWN